MTTDEFWLLIARSKRGTDDTWEQGEKLTELLKQLSVEEIVEFDTLFCGYLQQAYRRDLLAVFSIVFGGPSDDGFLYFRAWLIGQGRTYFEAALINPESAARRIKDINSDGENEALLTSALAAYEENSGEEFEGINYDSPEPLAGERWEEEDLPTLYPKLWKKFRYNSSKKQ